MSGLDGTADGLPQGDANQHHLAGAGEFSTGEMGNFQPALTHQTDLAFQTTLLGHSWDYKHL